MEIAEDITPLLRGVLHEARVRAVAPYLHAGRREVHVSRHIADWTGLVLAQAWLAVASHLFQQNAQAGFGLVGQIEDCGDLLVSGECLEAKGREHT